MKKNIIIFLTLFIIFFIITILSPIELDSIWCYGFSFNITKGLIPYKDYNMVIGPLYSLIFSVPMLLGNYVILFKIAHALFYSLVFVPIYKKIGLKSAYIIFLVASTLTVCGYNMFIVMLFLLILLLLDNNKKYNEVIIGIIIGMIIMTKQNIGGCLAILYFFVSKNKVKSVISVLIGVLPVFIYLIFTNSFYQYIDFCYLGLGNFLDNFVLEPFSLIIWVICLYISIKMYKKNKDIKLLYIFVFQIIGFPIIDQEHIIPAIIPIIYYILLVNNNKKIELYIRMFTIIGFIVMNIVNPLIKCEFNTKNNFLKYQFQPKNFNNYLENYSKYIDSLDGKLYLFIDNAYIVRIYRNENPRFYDLINKGNLGKDTDKYLKQIDKECKEETCYFILDKYFFKKEKYGYNQRPDNFKNYVINNDIYVKTLPSGDRLYKNN